jgi:LPXTG-motif cell wall-anchored protein
MTTRHVRSALVASLLTFGMVTVATTTGRAQDIQTLPEGRITMTGCFTQTNFGPKDKEMFVLARPMVGTVASVQEPTCTPGANDMMVRVRDLKQAQLGLAQIGRFVTISGRLRQSTSQGLRQLRARTFALVPVVVPTPPVAVIIQPAPAPVAEAAPTPAPQVAEVAPYEPAPVATTGEYKPKRKHLPKTATSVPLFGLIGLLSITGGFGLMLFNRRRVEQA